MIFCKKTVKYDKSFRPQRTFENTKDFISSVLEMTKFKNNLLVNLIRLRKQLGG
jgi:hypothetical protein